MWQKILRTAVLLAVVTAVGGCASTKVISSWRDPAFTRPIHQILVICQAKREPTRRAFESAFVAALQSRGVHALPGFSVLPGADASQQQVEAVARRAGADAILITKLEAVHRRHERVTEVEIQAPFPGPFYPFPYYHYWYDDYASGLTTVRSYDVVYKVLDLDTSLYDFAGGKLIWTTLTRTTTEHSIQQQSAAIARVLVGKLAADGLL